MIIMKRLVLIAILSMIPLLSAFPQWQKVDFPPSEGINVLAYDDIYNMLYAGTGDSGIYRSSDLGQTWIAANNGIYLSQDLGDT